MEEKPPRQRPYPYPMKNIGNIKNPPPAGRASV
jgi:hypothetical protein